MKIYEIVAEHNTLNEKGEIGKIVAKGFQAAKSALSGADDAAKAGKKGLAPTTQAAKDYKAARAANAEKFSTKGLKGADKFDQLKKLADANKAARAAAEAKVNSFAPSVLTLLQIGLGIATVKDYYTRLEYLDSQWKAFLAGDKNTEYFSDFNVDDPAERAAAQNVADQIRERLLGEITALVAMNVAGATVAKGMQMIGGVTKALGSAVPGTGIATTGAGIQKLTSLVSKLGKAGNVAVLGVLQTKAGQEFLNLGIMQSITGFTGSIVAKIIEKGIEALEAAGITVPDALKSPVAASRPTSYSGDQDPSDRTVYIGPYNYPVTDRTGKLLPGIEQNRMVQAIRRHEQSAGRPDPLAGIKR